MSGLGVEAFGGSGSPGSEVPGDFPEFVEGIALTGAQWTHEVFETVIQMVPDQGLLGLLNRLLHRLQLLRNLQAGAPVPEHVDGAAQVPAGPAQAFDDGRVGGMCVRLCHGCSYPLGEVTIVAVFALETNTPP